MADPADMDALAKRYIELWQEQLSRVSTDPSITEAWRSVFEAAAKNIGWTPDAVAAYTAAPSPQTQSKAPARLGPRPLPLHLAMEGLTLQMCFAGLTPWSNGSVLSKPIRDAIEQQTGQSCGESPWTDVVDPEVFIEALTQAGQDRLGTFSQGVQAYQRHPHRRDLSPVPKWTGPDHLPVLDYRGPKDGTPVLVVPSLINKAYVLDLFEDRSFMRFLAAKGLRPFLLDWTAPQATSSDADLTSCIGDILVPVLTALKKNCGRPAVLVGYCMGGTLAAAPAALHPDLVSALVLLAAPWDFHADSGGLRYWLTHWRAGLEGMVTSLGHAPVDLLQALFAGLDPTLVGRKFRSFAAMDQTSDEAKRFVILEDWLNDGLPLAGPVAVECLFDWYLDNTPVHDQWLVGDRPVVPENIKCPTLAVIPQRDRIVPPKSAEALAARIPNTHIQSVALGHIGMITGGRAAQEVYQPVSDWIMNAATQ